MNKLYCNPINLDYKFQKQKNSRTLYREAADPSVVYYNNQFIMFASMSGGYWKSNDMLKWDFVKIDVLPATEYAPDIRIIDKELYFSSSRRTGKGSFYKALDLERGKWEKISETFPFWDPNLFQDDDGSVYFYWGCDAANPLYGIKIEKNTFLPTGDKIALFGSNTAENGWERNGENNVYTPPKSLFRYLIYKFVTKGRPFIEGAWMTKYNDKYYLQYAAPGTQYNIYADGVYISDNPLSGFKYAEHNPVSLKPGGFIRGAGHGSTFQDEYGNWWHATSMSISVNDAFERRIGIFPAGFDEDGVFFCNMNFGDYPTNIPDKKWSPMTDSFAGLMLLSYEKNVNASSALAEYPVENIVDENVRTHWAAKKDDTLKNITLDLDNTFLIKCIQINFAEHNCFSDKSSFNYEGELWKREILFEPEYYSYTVYASVDQNNWDTLYNCIDSDKSHNLIQVDTNKEYRYIKVHCEKMPYNGNFALSGLRVFGKGSGQSPYKPVIKKIKRVSDLDAIVEWEGNESTTGYNVRWGIAPDKLYLSWMVYGSNKLKLSSLSKGQSYYVMIEAFNEYGITQSDTTHLDCYRL